MSAARIIDCHAHVVDPVRFPYVDGPGYKPLADEAGTREEFTAVLDAHGVAHALLVQPSCYGYANAALLDAMAAYPGRFKTIAVLDPATPEAELEALAKAGIVGVRFNLVSYDREALARPAAQPFLQRLKALGWFVQVYAHDEQWPELARLLHNAEVKVLVDHFGVRELAGGVERPGFQAVLRLGREGNAAVKLSAPFRISRDLGRYADLAPFAEAAIAAFGIERCVWGSDWPFVNVPGGFRYAAALEAVDRWLGDADARECLFWRNPIRLFGFGEVSS